MIVTLSLITLGAFLARNGGTKQEADDAAAGEGEGAAHQNIAAAGAGPTLRRPRQVNVYRRSSEQVREQPRRRNTWHGPRVDKEPGQLRRCKSDEDLPDDDATLDLRDDTFIESPSSDRPRQKATSGPASWLPSPSVFGNGNWLDWTSRWFSSGEPTQESTPVSKPGLSATPEAKAEAKAKAKVKAGRLASAGSLALTPSTRHSTGHSTGDGTLSASRSSTSARSARSVRNFKFVKAAKKAFKPSRKTLDEDDDYDDEDVLDLNEESGCSCSSRDSRRASRDSRRANSGGCRASRGHSASPREEPPTAALNFLVTPPPLSKGLSLSLQTAASREPHEIL